jgi:toxin ParE1/3/4
MAAEYRLRPKAQTDIEEIWTYSCETWGTGKARLYLNKLHLACTYLVKHPETGILRNDLYKGLHVYQSGKHLIFYLPAEYGIDIIRILHERMDNKLHLP